MPTEIFHAANDRDGIVRSLRVERQDDDQHYRYIIEQHDKETGDVVASQSFEMPHDYHEILNDKLLADREANPPRKRIYP